MGQIKKILCFQPIYYLNKVFRRLMTVYWNWINNQQFKYQAECHNHILFRGKTILRFGKNVHVYIGKNLSINSGDYCINSSNTSKIIVYDGATLIIGNNVGISSSSITVSQEIRIGNNVNIGSGSTIMDTNFHSLDSSVRKDRSQDTQNAISKPIRICDNSFIGTRCIILKGVTIGVNSIVAAGSVVVKDIPDNEVWGGNPAKFIKKISA